MSKRLFGSHYYSFEDHYKTKGEAQKAAAKFRVKGKYHVRVAKTGLGPAGCEYWGVYLRVK
ncbi:MAG: hypothetical protein R6U93_00855 [Dehalococcoidia bacterium]